MPNGGFSTNFTNPTPFFTPITIEPPPRHSPLFTPEVSARAPIPLPASVLPLSQENGRRLVEPEPSKHSPRRGHNRIRFAEELDVNILTPSPQFHYSTPRLNSSPTARPASPTNTTAMTRWNGSNDLSLGGGLPTKERSWLKQLQDSLEKIRGGNPGGAGKDVGRGACVSPIAEKSSMEGLGYANGTTGPSPMDGVQPGKMRRLTSTPAIAPDQIRSAVRSLDKEFEAITPVSSGPAPLPARDLCPDEEAQPMAGRTPGPTRKKASRGKYGEPLVSTRSMSKAKGAGKKSAKSPNSK